ncbi:hypothetical protein SO802_022696 [Lithocarpus litseifolius]|uniref:Uncharacterized protein n=1 Tax=Lithocarpus litseifolius TaxID=425828 RepID=A0AAW2C4W3_9ROSI
MSGGRDGQATARAQGLLLTTTTTTLSLSVCGVDADDDGVPVGAMPESVGGEYCLFGDRLWDDHIAVLLIHELGLLIRKPQKGICVILTPMVALVQQVIWLVHCTIMKCCYFVLTNEILSFILEKLLEPPGEIIHPGEILSGEIIGTSWRTTDVVLPPPATQ